MVMGISSLFVGVGRRGERGEGIHRAAATTPRFWLDVRAKTSCAGLAEAGMAALRSP
jgi:hypothetical protein